MDSSNQWSKLIVQLQRDNAAIDAAYMTGQLGTKIKELADDARAEYEAADSGQDDKEGAGVPISG